MDQFVILKITLKLIALIWDQFMVVKLRIEKMFGISQFVDIKVSSTAVMVAQSGLK